MKTLTDIKHLAIAISISAVVFGFTGYLAYTTALELHTTGSELIKMFL